ncbi:PREDICTED: DNA-directed RNA polymerase V subunit 5C [Fragaria vesca subsp. vesca]|uniref:DNA-directed RNA polymerase V subunit 5C n=1 Tax=Fragaria vesca subsp. vesca TaxID=101020 RepID=UPI0002C321F6|nr:PREDICTED: DNA-directed RNA polymerase V subunit 5C [Fragaria vesca subsp. vesca]
MAAVASNDAVSPGGGYRPGCMTSHVVQGSLESYRYYMSRRTVMEMLSDRGYNVPDSELTRSLTEFHTAFGQNPDLDRVSFSVSLRSNPKKKIMVLFCGTDEIRKANAREIYAKLMNKDISSLMLVLQSKINSFARKELETYPYKVETFHISELLVNVTKHVLHPKYEILTAEEKKNLLRKYKLEDKKLPLMLETDAFARYYGLEKGQVVKITYRGGAVGALKTYRCIG